MVMQEEGFVRPTFMRLGLKSQNFLPTGMSFLDPSDQSEGITDFGQLPLRLVAVRKTRSTEPKS